MKLYTYKQAMSNGSRLEVEVHPFAFWAFMSIAGLIGLFLLYCAGTCAGVF